jgi:hypothetical protein
MLRDTGAVNVRGVPPRVQGTPWRVRSLECAEVWDSYSW